jgi:predicted  nucleic acid-binding Zn-ribbon protein
MKKTYEFWKCLACGEIIEITDFDRKYLTVGCDKCGYTLDFKDQRFKTWKEKFKVKKFKGISNGEDTQCFIDCKCGEHLSVADWKLYSCPKCGMRYKTEFIIWQYEPEEK